MVFRAEFYPRSPMRLLLQTFTLYSFQYVSLYWSGPAKWKFADISPVFKKDDPTITSNYRPISLLCVISKVLERFVFNHCYHHLSPSFYQFQHGFFKGKSTTTQLLEVYHDILDSVASGNEVDVIFLDLSKALVDNPPPPNIGPKGCRQRRNNRKDYVTMEKSLTSININ